ncbi:pre-mRNA-splicing factor syf1, partial [Kickxella alabastrina]
MDIDLSDSDLRYEQEVSRTPYKLSVWQRYISHKELEQAESSTSNTGSSSTASTSTASTSTASTKTKITTQRSVFILYERALQRLPGSYKLWKQYLDRRRSALRGKNPLHHTEHFVKVNLCYERALLLLHRMPRLWLDYGAFLAAQPDVGACRRAYDRALRAVAVTQHARIWHAYLRFARAVGGVACERVWARWVGMWPQGRARFAGTCMAAGLWARAAQMLVDDLGAHARSANGEAWAQLVRLVRAHPGVLGGRTEPVLRDGARACAAAWPALAAHLAAQGKPARARDVFEEALAAVGRVADFAAVFDAYAAFEQECAAAALQRQAEAGRGQAGRGQAAADLALARLERLVGRRALLANAVVLRQRPGDVDA